MVMHDIMDVVRFFFQLENTVAPLSSPPPPPKPSSQSASQPVSIHSFFSVGVIFELPSIFSSNSANEREREEFKGKSKIIEWNGEEG